MLFTPKKYNLRRRGSIRFHYLLAFRALHKTIYDGRNLLLIDFKLPKLMFNNCNLTNYSLL